MEVVYKDAISDTISFYPNQIRFLSPTIKENRGFIYIFFYDEIPFGVFPEYLDLNQFVHLNTMVVTIFDNKFLENLKCFYLKTSSDIAITFLKKIDDEIGAWYEYSERQNIWNYKNFWTWKMWVVLIVLKLLLHLVAEKSYQKENK